MILTFPSPPLFGFCVVTAVVIIFWSAVVAGGITGPDGVLLCMNGELGDFGLNRLSLNSVYTPPASLPAVLNIVVLRSTQDLLEWVGKRRDPLDSVHIY